MKKVLFVIFGILVLLSIGYFVGPTPTTPVYSTVLPVVPHTADALEAYVSNTENQFKLRPRGARAEIVWANDSAKNKTEYAVLYLHGFSATWYEGQPLHRNVANALNANLYLARLQSHGIETNDPLLDYTAEGVWETTKDAFAIAQQLGEKVIVIGTSTGGTLGLMLAAEYDLAALVNLSPNIEVNDPSAFLLNDPWGLEIAKMVFGGDFRSWEADDSSKTYWHTKYRLEALPQLQQLLEDNMNAETFAKITEPVFTACYYKDEQNQDPVVKVSAMRNMHQQLATPEGEKVFVAFPNAGDHVIGSPLKSKSHKEVEAAVLDFLVKL